MAVLESDSKKGTSYGTVAPEVGRRTEGVAGTGVWTAGSGVRYFGGTPCVHQKITIQISQKERILGYVKVTESEDIYQIFDHEN